jgi:hypothetical protein
MDVNNLNLKKLSKIALVAMVILFIGSIVYYRQRVFFADASFILFSILNYKTFYIQEHRYGSFITQMIPYLGQKMHLPLRAIIIGYSVSFNLFYLLVAALLYRFRQYALVLIMSLYYFLFISATYFWVNNEIHQAVAWMFLLLGVTMFIGKRKANPVWLFLTFPLLAFLTVFTHFVVLIPLLFLWVYMIIDKDNWPFSKLSTWLLSVILVFVVVAKFAITKTGQYDGDHIHGVTHFSIKDVINTFRSPVVRMFVYRCIINYWTAIIVFGMSMVFLVKSNKRLLAIWSLVSVIGYLIIMGLTYGGYDSSLFLFHVESEWACIGILMAAGFVFEYLPHARINIAIGLLTGIILVRLLYIYSAEPSFAVRYHANEQLLGQMKKKGITKLGLSGNDEFVSINKLTWGLSYESLLMSGTHGDKTHLTFCYIPGNNMTIREQLTTSNGWFDGWNMLPPGTINREYFLIDSSQPYKIMTWEELFK